MIHFQLNGQPRSVAASPDTSVLELLRETLGQVGTKEGCASGDCGACTVAIGEVNAAGKMHYHSANSCIMPAHQLQGRSLVTVEGLADGNHLHPAQSAMVACHASQCGFCTPGIVMSLFTLHEAQPDEPAPLTPERLEAALGGNLCRCTGYRPIRDAALSMADHPAPRNAWWHDASALPAGDTKVKADGTSTEDSFVQPATLATLLAARKRYPEAPLVAGGTDLWLNVTQSLKRYERVIDVTRVDELLRCDTVTLDDGRTGWWIGAAVTYTQLMPLLDEHFPGFAHLLHRLGSAQIRNRGTLGGNIANASPIGDTPPVLLALEARLWLAGPEGERELALDEFFIDYKKTALGEGEVIRAVFLPAPRPDHTLKVWKISKRREDDISALLGAFHWRMEQGVLREVRLAFGGMAATPKRAYSVEAALEGQPPTDTTFAAARAALLEAFTPLSDVRSSAEYRQLAAANLLERLHLVVNAPEPAKETMLHAYAH
ncbi:MAG: xanthine dehydrogenase small subunit [Halomonas sp.]|nr:xanthine dehydrogenase small subunit [Halomonas sp.]TVM07667.1 MAG: xanthine dehydrogenase small subunit [Halomonas sp.]